MTPDMLSGAVIGLGCLCSPVLLLVVLAMTLALWQEHSRKLAIIQDARRAALLAWIAALPTLRYRNEIEVEIKFIAPLVAHLGYAGVDIQARLSVGIPAGRQVVNGVADWVISRSGRPFLVIEAKEPGQKLNDAVQAQARSYAVALNAPYYLLANGLEIALFLRSAQEDRCLLRCDVVDLGKRWHDLASRIGK